MKTRAVRLYGESDLRLEEFDMGELKDDEILMELITDSVCMSTYKESIQGAKHQRVNDDISEHPIIVGHEFAGIIREVGAKWKDKYQVGTKYTMQPAINIKGSMAAIGYSYEYCGGAATFIKVPPIVMEKDCLLPFDENSAFFEASLAEPMSCIIGAFHATYHTTPYVYEHQMGLKDGGSVALLGCAGPMGLGAIDYAVHGPYNSKRVVVVDIDEARLERAKLLINPEDAAKNGVELIYVNTKDNDHAVEDLKNLNDGKGYNETFVFAPVKPLIEMADHLLGNDGCLNFFAGPTDNEFSANFNFYNVHYESTHICGTSGGSTGDMLESLKLSEEGKINPSYMITHIGGINAAPDTILNLPKIPGGKKLIYPHIKMELTAIEDFEKLGKDNEMFAELARICKKNHNVWCEEAEKYLLKTMALEK